MVKRALNNLLDRLVYQRCCVKGCTNVSTHEGRTGVAVCFLLDEQHTAYSRWI